MRLIGYAMTNPDGPVRAAYMRLDDLTVVLGPNDSGKSRLVRGLTERLGGRPLEHAQDIGDCGAAFYVEFTVQEMLAFVPRVVRDQRSRVAVLDDFSEAARIVVDGLRVPLSDSARDLLIAGLARSRVFAFEPSKAGAEGPWRVHWALAPERDPRLVDILRRIARGPIDDSNDLDVLLLIADDSRPGWRMLDEAPACVSVGEMATPPVPRPVTVPMSWPALEAECAASVEGLLRLLRFFDDNRTAMDDVSHDAETLPHAIAVLRSHAEETPDLWTDTSPAAGARKDLWLTATGRDAIALSPDAHAIAGLWRQEMQDALPRFVQERHAVDSPLASIWNWSEEHPVRLRLHASPVGNEVPMSAAADGLQIWLQLAAFEATDGLRRAAVQIRRKLKIAVDSAETLAARGTTLVNAETDLLEERNPDDMGRLEADRREAQIDFDEVADGVVDALGILHDTVEGLRRFEFIPEDEPFFEELLALGGAPLPGSDVPLPRPPLYVLDEPERHLHPALQPIAALWLNDMMRQRSSQAVIITHAVPFLNLGEHTAHNYVSRNASGFSHVDPIDATNLTALSQEAAELGLNRGQLLANIGVVLFVEGRADQIVMEALFGPRLQAMGVAVTPLSGAGRHAQIFDSDLLLRYTTAHLALMLDNLRQSEVNLLMTDEAALEAALRSRKTELQAAASVIKNASRYGRVPLPIFPHPARDVFDLLDPGVLARQFPRFPGHPEAQAEFAGQKKQTNRKLFYEQCYGIRPELETYAVVADAMRREGRSHEALERVVEQVEIYALTGAAHRATR